MRKTQIRAFIGTVFAIAILLIGAAFAASAMGKDVPILRDISAALGF